MSLKRLWEPGWDYFGPNTVGELSSNCDGLLAGYAEESPERYHRCLVDAQSSSTPIADNGEYTNPGSFEVKYWIHYVNGVAVDSFVSFLGPQPDPIPGFSLHMK